MKMKLRIYEILICFLTVITSSRTQFFNMGGNGMSPFNTGFPQFSGGGQYQNHNHNRPNQPNNNNNWNSWNNMMQPNAYPQLSFNPYSQQLYPSHNNQQNSYQPYNMYQPYNPYNQQYSPASQQPVQLQPVSPTQQSVTPQIRPAVAHNHGRGTPTQLPRVTSVTLRPPTSTNSEPSPDLFDNVNCGPTSTVNKILGGNDTDIDEFPWMALLQYRNSTGHFAFACGGMLINKRYVLTAGHCIKGAIEKARGPLVSVRLGEFNLETDPDCIQYASGMECTDKVVDIPVESIIPHHQFVDQFDHDIGLVRLSQEVNYSDYIRPICIPWYTANSAQGDSVVVAGWGRTLAGRRSPTKQKLTILIANKPNCVHKYGHEGRTITDNQICAGGNYLEDTCDGDSGGPLMALVNDKWYAEGIVSFGYRCGIEGWPAIYTRVNAYTDWILNSVRN